jgi:hypothetical protein
LKHRADGTIETIDAHLIEGALAMFSRREFGRVVAGVPPSVR